MVTHLLSHLWNMTSDHSAVVQAVATTLSVPLLIGTFLFTLRTLTVAGRQAKAAENAANVGIKQLAQSALSQDRATQPLLQVDFDPTDKALARLRNVGLGPAFDIVASVADRPDLPVHCFTDVLGVNEQTELRFSNSDVGIYGLRISYKSAHERPHECVCRLDERLVFVHEHRSFKCELDELSDISFEDSRRGRRRAAADLRKQTD